MHTDPGVVKHISTTQMIEAIEWNASKTQPENIQYISLHLLSNIAAVGDLILKEALAKNKNLLTAIFSKSLNQSTKPKIIEECVYVISNIINDSNAVVVMEFVRNEYFVSFFEMAKMWRYEAEPVKILFAAMNLMLDYGDYLKADYQNRNPVFLEIRDRIELDSFLGYFKKVEQLSDVRYQIREFETRFARLGEEDEDSEERRGFGGFGVFRNQGQTYFS